MQGERAPAAAPPHAQPTELILLLYLFSARTRSAHGLRPCLVDCVDSSGGRPLRTDLTREKTTSSPVLLSTFDYVLSPSQTYSTGESPKGGGLLVVLYYLLHVK
eukprot:scaffold22347_cov69-Cylindrotheca_fusiformis.AAC.1